LKVETQLQMKLNFRYFLPCDVKRNRALWCRPPGVRPSVRPSR